MDSLLNPIVQFEPLNSPYFPSIFPQLSEMEGEREGLRQEAESANERAGKVQLELEVQQKKWQENLAAFEREKSELKVGEIFHYFFPLLFPSSTSHFGFNFPFSLNLYPFFSLAFPLFIPQLPPKQILTLEASSKSGSESADLRSQIADLEARLAASEAKLKNLKQLEPPFPPQNPNLGTKRQVSALEGLGLDSLREERLVYRERAIVGTTDVMFYTLLSP